MNKSDKTTRLLTFKVQYFKPSGKYYTEGTFPCVCTTTEMDDGLYSAYMVDGIQEFRSLQESGVAPGLSGNGKDFHALISHPDGYPVLLLNNEVTE